jgi:hypothetical protein
VQHSNGGWFVSAAQRRFAWVMLLLVLLALLSERSLSLALPFLGFWFSWLLVNF